MGCRPQAFHAAFGAAGQVGADQAALVGVFAVTRYVDGDPLAVQPRTIAETRGKQLVARRVVDHPDPEAIGVAIADADAEMGYALKEVGRAVDRVDDPQALGVDRQRLVVWALFAQKAILGGLAEEDVADRVLDHYRGPDQQVAAILDLEVEGVAEVFACDAAAFARGAHRGVQAGRRIHTRRLSAVSGQRSAISRQQLPDS